MYRSLGLFSIMWFMRETDCVIITMRLDKNLPAHVEPMFTTHFENSQLEEQYHTRLCCDLPRIVPQCRPGCARITP